MLPQRRTTSYGLEMSIWSPYEEAQRSRAEARSKGVSVRYVHEGDGEMMPDKFGIT